MTEINDLLHLMRTTKLGLAHLQRKPIRKGRVRLQIAEEKMDQAIRQLDLFTEMLERNDG